MYDIDKVKNKKNTRLIIFFLVFAFLIVGAGTTFSILAAQDAEEEVEISEEITEDLNEGFTIFRNDSTRVEEEVEFEHEVSLEGYEEIAENEDLILYVNSDTLGIKIENKATGYIWEGTSDRDEGDMNQIWQGLKDSAVTFVFEMDNRTHQASTSLGARIDISPSDNGFTADVRLRDSGIEFKLEVGLDGKDLVVNLPYEDIVATKDHVTITSVWVYPFMGSTYIDDIPGYMMIPDGPGALIRLGPNDMVSQPYQAKFYGQDLSIDVQQATGQNLEASYSLKYPVFGMAHGVNQNAFLAVVESGAEYGRLQAYTSGVTTAYNWVASQFLYRVNYFQATNQRGEGFNLIQDNANEFDLRMRYKFLEGEEANYVGMANSYKSYLTENGSLNEETIESNSDVPLLVKTFMHETRPALIGQENISMTTTENIREMVESLGNAGIENLDIMAMNWLNGGTMQMSLNHSNPIEGNGSWSSLAEDLDELGVDLFYEAQYFRAYEDTNSFNGTVDGANRITEIPISSLSSFLGNQQFHISPDVAIEHLLSELEQFQNIGTDGIYLASAGDSLYSDYNDGYTSRLRAKEILNTDLSAEGFDQYYANPFDFLLNNASGILDMPINHSGYMSFTDTVPFVPILLSGHLPLFSEDINLNASDSSSLLRYIDFGIYPSYLLSYEDPVVLLETSSSYLYTSRFEIWQEHVVDSWTTINDALKDTGNGVIVNRVMLEDGLSQVTYENGTVVYVNYTDVDMTVDGLEIPALSYAVEVG